MILAGGYGTRLAPVLGSLPKGLAPIRGRPFLDLLVDFLVRQGVTKLVFCVGHHRQPLIDRYRSWPGVETAFSEEVSPLGTGGAIRHALPQVTSGQFFVLNGDSFCDIDLNALLRHHVEHGAQATLVAARMSDRNDVGTIQLDADGRVLLFTEKTPALPGRAVFMNAGIYILERSLFKDVREAQLSLEHELIPRWAHDGRCSGFVTEAEVVDIGTPDRYAEAQDRL